MDAPDPYLHFHFIDFKLQYTTHMGLYSKVNKSFGRQYYYREFDKKYLTFPDTDTSVKYLISLHEKILRDIHLNKRDVIIEKQEEVDYFQDSLKRNKCDIPKEEFTVPLIVFTAMRSTPSSSHYRKSLDLLIENGVIPPHLLR